MKTKDMKTKDMEVGYDKRRNSNSTCQENYRNNNKTNGKGKKEEINEGSKLELRERALELIGESLVALSNESRVNIVRCIQKNEEATFEMLRQNFNLNNNTLTFHLQKLLNARIISQPKNRGPYQLGPLGDRMLQLLDVLEDDISSILEKIIS